MQAWAEDKPGWEHFRRSTVGAYIHTVAPTTVLSAISELQGTQHGDARNHARQCLEAFMPAGTEQVHIEEFVDLITAANAMGRKLSLTPLPGKKIARATGAMLLLLHAAGCCLHHPHYT